MVCKSCDTHDTYCYICATTILDVSAVVVIGHIWVLAVDKYLFYGTLSFLTLPLPRTVRLHWCQLHSEDIWMWLFSYWRQEPLPTCRRRYYYIHYGTLLVTLLHVKSQLDSTFLYICYIYFPPIQPPTRLNLKSSSIASSARFYYFPVNID